MLYTVSAFAYYIFDTLTQLHQCQYLPFRSDVFTMIDGRQLLATSTSSVFCQTHTHANPSPGWTTPTGAGCTDHGYMDSRPLGYLWCADWKAADAITGRGDIGSWILVSTDVALGCERRLKCLTRVSTLNKVTYSENRIVTRWTVYLFKLCYHPGDICIFVVDECRDFKPSIQVDCSLSQHTDDKPSL